MEVTDVKLYRMVILTPLPAPLPASLVVYLNHCVHLSICACVQFCLSLGIWHNNTSCPWRGAQLLFFGSGPILLECISELVDVLWLARPSPDLSPKDVPQMFSWRQIWGLCWLWDSLILQNLGDLQQHVDDDLLHCCLDRWMHSHAYRHRAHQKAEWHCLHGRAQWHSPAAEVEFCPPSHSDSFTNHDTSTSIVVVCNHGWRLIMLPSSTPNPLLPIMKIENEF